MNQHRDRGRPPPRPQQGGQRPPPPHPAQAGQRPGQEVERVEQLWPDYLKDSYFDAEGNLRIDYVSREKVEPLVREMARARPALTTAQIRRFFQHCRRIETHLKSREAAWAQVKPQVVFLDAAAEDAYGKQPRKIPALFRDFIQRNIAAIHSEKDLREGFLPHFEALVGFGATHIQRDRN
jgi:CRISPR type III-A-associated protein Csm2